IIGINPREGTDPVKFVHEITNGTGADGVIITASAKGDEIISQAAQMSRKRGRIILIGVIGLNISRAEFYEKELTFQVSCSYGPGRYDENYEQKGQDYPLAFVRWTEKRNFETILRAISSGKLEVKSLITERVSLAEYNRIYGSISNRGSIASLLVYPEESDAKTIISVNAASFVNSNSGIGIIGAGNFTAMTMLPSLKKTSAQLVVIASARGVSATALAQKYGIAKSATDYREVISDPEVALVMVTTRHNLHAKMVVECLEKKKHVFVEKPLALNNDELNEIIQHYNRESTLTVGFNRRFSPHIQKMKQLLGAAPMNVIATMNSGHIPPNVWVHDIMIGGGRIIGEACHYIDLISFLTDSKVKSVCMNAMGVNPGENTDNASILLKYENGSTGVINYFSNGSKSYSKERVEVYSQDRTLVMDNFRETTGYGFKGFSKMKTKLDKGHNEQFRLLTERLKKGGASLIPFEELINTTKPRFAAIESLTRHACIEVSS
ncbi:MAG: Gfo/Idh/MocA family oxidoreductase, partial [Ginsengibacter sp.]